jgi:hypothetical protein
MKQVAIFAAAIAFSCIVPASPNRQVDGLRLTSDATQAAANRSGQQ